MLRRDRPQCAGTAVDPAAIAFEHALEVGALDPLGQLIGDRLEGTMEVEVEAERLLAGRDDLRRQVLGLDHGTGRGDDHLLDDVLELADVAGPVVAGQAREGLARERLGGHPPLLEPLQDVVDQERDIIEPLAERGQLDRDHVEAIVQILAEPAGGDRLGQVEVRGGEDAAVGADDVGPADPLERPVLEHAEQLGLHAQGKLADLVEEERSPFGLLEPPFLLPVGAGEGAPLVAEELALQQRLGQGRAVDRDQRPVPGGVGVVDRLGDQFLARPRLTRDQHGAGGRGNPGDPLEDLAHPGAASHQVVEGVALLESLPQRPDFILELAVLERLLDEDARAAPSRSASADSRRPRASSPRRPSRSRHARSSRSP